jgi:hypothetical protein
MSSLCLAAELWHVDVRDLVAGPMVAARHVAWRELTFETLRDSAVVCDTWELSRRLLDRIERDVIARGVFTSVTYLKRKLMRYIRKYNDSPKPVKWVYRTPTHRITTDSRVTANYDRSSACVGDRSRRAAAARRPSCSRW